MSQKVSDPDRKDRQKVLVMGRPCPRPHLTKVTEDMTSVKVASVC